MVFLVAVPLSLGIAVASGAPVMSGLIAGVVGGVVAGLLGGSALQVSGPAAGLTVVVAGLVDQFGWAVTCAITAAAGLLQILFGVSRIARSALAISPPVVRGMLAGIGITIALGQLHVLLGGTAQTDAWAKLLSAVAVDKLRSELGRPGPRSNLDRELIGQGTANSVSGLLGGLPITGVIVRSATNVRAGARTRVSGVLHGALIALFAVFLVGLIEQIPLAVLAGLLIVIGMQMVTLADLRTARRQGELMIYVSTVVGVVLLNLLEGVLIGLALSVLLMLRRVVRAAVRPRRGRSAVDGQRRTPDQGAHRASHARRHGRRRAGAPGRAVLRHPERRLLMLDADEQRFAALDDSDLDGELPLRQAR